MRLKREQVRFLAGRIVDDLVKEKLIEVDRSDLEMLRVMVDDFVLDQLLIEDRLNDEVRKLLDQYRDKMRRENISYQDMFKMIKKRLIDERNLVV
ncbi:MAG: hypothetical protein DRH70_02095 [Candidatus Coatesbacteria bacterium]|nr:MAG: hypothetical protein DRH70_02095 [Candidatus Coatesbacteria bacterium]